MSSRLHNKWHRHNHHTNPSTDTDFPDSGHDPIASPDSPFQGDFVLNGGLSASQDSTFANVNIAGNVVSEGRVTVNNIVDATEIRTSTIRVLSPSRSFGGTTTHSGKYLTVNIDGQDFYIPLWKAS